MKTQHRWLNGNVASANKRIPSSLGSAMHALIHCSGWTRTVLLTSKVKERDVARTKPFICAGCIYQRRGGNVRAITDFAITAIHSLQRCIRRRKPPDARNIELSFSSSARVALHHGLRIDPLTHTHKDFS